MDINARQVFKTMFKKGDLILVVVLIIAVALTVWFATKPNEGIAQIYVDGELKYEISLDADTSVNLLDGKMTVTIKNGTVSVEDSDCAEQLCVNSAPIDSEGGMIICLPNRVVVKVVSREVDAIA